MSRSLSSPVNENQDFVDDTGEKSAGFGDERDGDIPMNEDIASRESNDDRDQDYDDADWVSDRESFSSVKPIVERTKNQHIIEVDGPIRSSEDDKLLREIFDFDSLVDEANNLHPNAGVDGLTRLNESNRIHQTVKNRFISGAKDFGVNAQVEHIHRNLFTASAITVARLKTFLIYEKAVKNKNGGHANVRYAWFGASKDQLNKIIAHGFSHDNNEKDGAFGYGVYLVTDNSPIESMNSSTVDDDGMRHILLCRVIPGKVEAVMPGSKQCHSSSDEFQTGVDNLESPRKLIIWSTQLNTHILPEFVISFKTLFGHNGPATKEVQFDVPLSPWMSIKAFISGLSKILPRAAIKKINEYHRNYVEHKISRHDMLLGFRTVAGDGPMLMVVKDFKERQQLKGDGSQGHLTCRRLVNT